MRFSNFWIFRLVCYGLIIIVSSAHRTQFVQSDGNVRITRVCVSSQLKFQAFRDFETRLKIRHCRSLFPATIRHAVRCPFINTVGLIIFREGVKRLCTLVNLGTAGSSFFRHRKHSLFRSRRNPPSSKKHNHLTCDSCQLIL